MALTTGIRVANVPVMTETKTNEIDRGRVAPSFATAEAVQRAVRLFGLMGFVKRAGDATGLSWSPLAAIGFGMPVAPMHLERTEGWLRSMALLPAVVSAEDESDLDCFGPSDRSES